MSLTNPTKDSRPLNAAPIPMPFDPRHMSAAPEPTLPRLTRLGPPTLPALDTAVPPLPVPQPGFKKADHAISPSVYSVASSSDESRRRSSQESADRRSLSSRSSTSAHDSYAPYKQGPWGSLSSAESQRKFSNQTDEVSPRSKPQKTFAPFGAQQIPPRRPVGAQPAQRTRTPPPHNQPPHLRPNNPQRSEPRSFLRTPSPPARKDQPRGDSPPVSPRSRPLAPAAGPHGMNLRSQFQVPYPGMPPRKGSAGSPSIPLHNLSMSMTAGPGPVLSGQYVYAAAKSARAAPADSPPPFAPFSTPQLQPKSPQTPHARSFSEPTSPTELPLSESEIIALWSHSCLLYHHGRVTDAVDTLHKVHERPGAGPLTLARLHLNLGIMTESLAKGRVHSKIPPHKHAQVMIEAFQAAIKLSPDGPEGALGTFLLGCSLFDSQDFEKSASCFDMCEAIFAGENDAQNYRLSSNNPWDEARGHASALQGGEKIDLTPLGLNWVLYLSAVRENWRIAQERARIPSGLGTMRGLHRIPQSMLLEDPLPKLTAPLTPLDESDEEGDATDNVRSTLGLHPEHSELVPMRLDIGDSPPPVAVMRRRTTKKQDREEMERRREARRTRILIKLGDLRLNKPLPPLPHELTDAERAERAERRERAAKKALNSPDVPPLPVTHVQNGMAFV